MAEEKENQEEQKEEGKKSNLMVIIVGAFLAVLLLIGGILAYVLLSGSEETPEGEAQIANSENSDSGGTTLTTRRKDSLNVGPMFELDTFIVNLLSENGRRYLKVKINLELSDEALQDEINKKIPVIRDIVIKIASSKTLEEISTEKGKEKFKDQIVGEINQNLQDGKINNVYFTDFVIQ